MRLLLCVIALRSSSWYVIIELWVRYLPRGNLLVQRISAKYVSSDFRSALSFPVLFFFRSRTLPPLTFLSFLYAPLPLSSLSSSSLIPPLFLLYSFPISTFFLCFLICFFYYLAESLYYYLSFSSLSAFLPHPCLASRPFIDYSSVSLSHAC